jgi:hypothetical protein
MVLKIPKIDDVTFAKLVEEAIKRIPQYPSEWTDYNLHDPGITFIELLAWLVEMQVYHLDQITERHFLKFLRLLGVEPRPALPSRAQITFNLSDSKAVQVDSGTKLEARTEKNLIQFETIDSLLVVPLKLQKIMVDAKDGTSPKHIDVDLINADSDTFFFAFSETPRENSALCLGFEKKFLGEGDVCLAINLFEMDLPPKGKHDEEPDVIPSSSVVWEYSKNGSWAILDVIADSTIALSQSGFVKFRSPTDITEDEIDGARFFWLRCSLKDSSYEIPPRIESIRLNTVEAVQMKKLEGQDPASPEIVSALPNQVFKLKQAPIVPRKLVVKVKEDRKWTEWTLVESFEKSGEEDQHVRFCFEKNSVTGENEAVIGFGNNKKGRIPPEGVDNIKVASYIYDKPAEEETFSSTGVADQVYLLKKVPPILKDVLVQIGECPFIWREVPDFDASLPEDKHYRLDLSKGEIQLGTACRGRIDPGSRIEAALYYCSDKEGGKISENMITAVANQIGNSNLSVTNFKASIGGKDAETLDEAILRARKDLKKTYKAVTLGDFEYLAKATPGLRVERAKALRSDDIVIIIVVPCRIPNSKNIMDKASDGFKKTICLHLDRHRLLTTRIEVSDPEYVPISVQATLKVKPLASAEAVKQRVIRELETFLHPLDGYDGSGWPFGRSVYTSEISAKIKKVDGVACVQSLTLTATGNAKYVNGNVAIGKNTLVYLDKHQIEIVETQEPCRSEWE